MTASTQRTRQIEPSRSRMTTTPDIRALVPHQGPMCLLDEVMHYDERAIACRATSHRSAGNPLRHEGRLPALAGIEYAAQALAAHCALVGVGADLRADHGVLAGVRAIALRVARIDDIDEALDVRAERLVADGVRLLYSFVVQAGRRELLSGRVAVVLRKEEAG